jgi:hypothetical protein
MVSTRTGRVNYTTMEEIPEGDQVLTGMFSLNGHPIVILFDSGASHDFISKACTEKHQFDVHPSNTPYLISTPCGKIATRHIARKTPLDLAGKVFKVFLIIHDGQGIDVILGMGRMKRHKALLDTATRVVDLDSPLHGDTSLQLSMPSVAPLSVRHTTAQDLDDIPIVCEFSDVFPEDLPGMPSD